MNVLIVGKIPSWFWFQNLPDNCDYEIYNEIVDVGLVQTNPFSHDLDLTLNRLKDILNLPHNRYAKLLDKVKNQNPHFVLCDISPMGIKVANELNKPSVLLENFTWDWIYEPFLRTNIKFKDIILSLEQIYAQSSIHIQCTPFCKNCTSSTKVNPIFRQGRETRKKVLSQLGLNQTDQYTLVTTGGISMHHTLSNLDNDLFLVVPGDFEKVFKQKQMIYIPMNSHIYFPDIVRYANCIVGKVGYGTVSECWGMNIPFLGVFREEFRESEVLKKFCLKNLIFKEIKLSEFLNGTWHNLSIQLASQKLGTKSIERISGASEVSEKIINLLFKKKYNHVSSWE